MWDESKNGGGNMRDDNCTVRMRDENTSVEAGFCQDAR